MKVIVLRYVLGVLLLSPDFRTFFAVRVGIRGFLP